MKDEELLRKANWLYPKGTVFNSLGGVKNITVDELNLKKSNTRTIECKEGYLYNKVDDKWAEIVSRPNQYFRVSDVGEYYPSRSEGKKYPGYIPEKSMTTGLYKVIGREFSENIGELLVLSNKSGVFFYKGTSRHLEEISKEEYGGTPANRYKGDLKGFPTEVVEKMLEFQVAQGNKRDVTVFENDKRGVKDDGGFDWRSDNIVGIPDFFSRVIGERDFSLFFKVFPNPETFSGKIKGWPKEIVHAMISNQVKQGNKPDKSIFEEIPSRNLYNRGFDWDKSTEGSLLWEKVLANGNHKAFFDKDIEESKPDVDLKNLEEVKKAILSGELWIDNNSKKLKPEDLKSLISEDTRSRCSYKYYYKNSLNDNIGFSNSDKKKSLIPTIEAKDLQKMLNVREEFKKGEYIVLIEDNGSSAFKGNHCYKQACNRGHIYVEISSSQIKNGQWAIYKFKDKDKTWRYATMLEIAEYNERGKPYDVSEVKPLEFKTVPRSAHASKGGRPSSFGQIVLYGTGGEVNGKGFFEKQFITGVDPIIEDCSDFLTEYPFTTEESFKKKNWSRQLVSDHFSPIKEKQEAEVSLRLPSEINIYKHLKNH